MLDAMPLGPLAVLLALLSSAPAEARPARTIEPAWAPASALARPEDRRLAARLLVSLCPGPQCPGEKALEASRIRARDGRDILLARMPSGGTCGAYEMAVYGAPRRRPSELLRVCGETLAVMPRRGNRPDVVTRAFVERLGPRGPVLETTIWRWTGAAYQAARRFRIHARTSP